MNVISISVLYDRMLIVKMVWIILYYYLLTSHLCTWQDSVMRFGEKCWKIDEIRTWSLVFTWDTLLVDKQDARLGGVVKCQIIVKFQLNCGHLICKLCKSHIKTPSKAWVWSYKSNWGLKRNWRCLRWFVC